MSQFKYSKDELKINKVLKMNQDISLSMLTSAEMSKSRKNADNNIAASIELLNSLGKHSVINKAHSDISREENTRIKSNLVIEDWDEIVKQANRYISEPVFLEDIMSEDEVRDAFKELDEINDMFSKKTSIINKVDISFLAIAIALQVVKTLIFPYIAEKFEYGEKIDKTKRLAHDDKSIKEAQKKANNKFRDKNLEKHGKGYWINILYQTPAYDITKGSKDLGINMGGAYHRMYTLGHDPILGWIFGTMNILTDSITFNNFQSYRVKRNPMKITNEYMSIGMLILESYDMIKADKLNLPAAIFAQAQHLKSDEYTKVGLPIPILSSINEDFASKLYKSNYDELCLARDMKIVGASFLISKIFDIIILLIHGLFRKEDESKELFEVRTRKILLISNTIASTSTIINTKITSNPKNLDIGSLLNTVVHLFSDISFMAKIKQEFVENEISERLQNEIRVVDCLYDSIKK